MLEFNRLCEKIHTLASDPKYYKPFGFKLNIGHFNEFLDIYPNKQHAQFLRQGILNGFPSHYSHHELPQDSFRNHPMPLKGKIALYASIMKELESGKMRFVSESETVILNPLGVVPKSTPGEFRPILDLSAPKHHSVNSGTSDEYKTCRLISFREVGNWLLQLGKNAFIGALDLKSAWRQLPISVEAQFLMGSRLEGYTLTDNALPLGWCESVRIFTILDDFLHFVLITRLPEYLRRQLKGIRWLIFYIDDFVIGAPSKELCEALLEHTINTFTYLGLEIK